MFNLILAVIKLVSSTPVSVSSYVYSVHVKSLTVSDRSAGVYSKHPTGESTSLQDGES